MFCPTCGSSLQPADRYCQKCGAAIPTAQPPQPVQYASPQPYYQANSVPSYLVQAILVTLFCCLPFGVVAIVYAAQVNSRLAAGDYYGAVHNSKNAKTWCLVSFFCGLGFSLIWLVITIAGGGR